MAERFPIIDATDRFTTRNYTRYPVAFVSGSGSRLVDEHGKSYLDFFSGLAVSSLGYGHAGLAKAIADQAATLIHTSNLYYTEPAARLAQRLVERTFADRVFFCNSGTEANEAAIKMARRHDSARHEIVSAFRSFHGRTLGALAATGQPDLQEGFGPMPGGFIHVPYDDVEAAEAAVGAKTAAVLVEPIIGEGGVIVPSAGYLRALREICDRTGALLIFDEVQTGVGRTGTLYAYEQLDVTPDILTTAKGLGGGMPIGALLAREEAANGFVPGSHGSTFGANPVSCRAALAVLDALDDGVLDNVVAAGKRLGERLCELAGKHAIVKQVRGRGLMCGIEIDRPARPLVERALSYGLILNATAGTVIRIIPPLVITQAEIDEGSAVVDRVLAEAAA
jgi:predicted acetylornithine/succinylornithine family transaminase